MTRAPIATSCQNWLTFSRFKPLLITPIKSEPTSVPQMLPEPPFMDVPPTTPATMQLSSAPLAIVEFVKFRRPASIIPEIPHRAPVMTYARSFIFSISTPDSLAAFSLPPMHFILIPNGVFSSKNHAAMYKASNTKMPLGKTFATLPAAIQRRPSGIISEFFAPVIMAAIPRKM